MESKKNFIIFSTADWDNPFWTNKQHTANQLAQMGHKVLYIESLGLRQPTVKSKDLSRILKRIFKFFKGSQKVQKNLWVYSPIVIPFHRFKLIRILNQVVLKLALKYFKLKLNLNNPIVWTYNPVVTDFIDTLKPSKSIYHSVDNLAASPGIDSELILNSEKKLFQKLDFVFCTSEDIFNYCSKNFDANKVHYFPNVVDYKHFAKAKEVTQIPQEISQTSSPIFGFIGAISEYKLDYKLIIDTAKSNPAWNFVLIGKIGEGQPLTSIGELNSLKNIHLLGPKKYEDLPKFLAFFNVCIIPCPINNYTNSMFPMKFFEYMASGKPIVARNINSLQKFKNSHYSYKNPGEFKQLLELALKDGVKNELHCESLAKEHTWENRLQKMLKIIFT